MASNITKIAVIAKYFVVPEKKESNY